jgi:hypothetical protein
MRVHASIVEKQRVRQPAVRYDQKEKKEQIYEYTDTEECVLVCMIV